MSNGVILIHDDGKGKFHSVEAYSKDFSELSAGFGHWDSDAIENYKSHINARIDELIAYRDSLDDKLTKVYVDYKGDPI